MRPNPTGLLDPGRSINGAGGDGLCEGSFDSQLLRTEYIHDRLEVYAVVYPEYSCTESPLGVQPRSNGGPQRNRLLQRQVAVGRVCRTGWGPELRGQIRGFRGNPLPAALTILESELGVV